MVIHAPPRTTTPQVEPRQPNLAPLPRHVAIIMDGSGRWAEERGLGREAGHRAGTENLRRIIEAVAERQVKYLTLFAFSTENWSRPRREVNALIRLVGKVIDRELAELHANGVRLLHIGSLDGLPGDLQRRVRDAIVLTRDNDRLTVTLAFNYGGRAEILEATRRMVRDGVPADQIDEALFSRYLDTRGLPDPDLVIRTSGEMRLSNFLLWQAAYAEYYFSPLLWPDFDEEEIDRALLAYGQRRRRFGGLSGNGRGKPDHRNGSSQDCP
jgi:undecaprenyl diphosphate synthase